MKKALMTKAEAEENVAEMRKNTAKPAMKRLLQLALGPLGNLSDDARKVYENELKCM